MFAPVFQFQSNHTNSSLSSDLTKKADRYLPSFFEGHNIFFRFSRTSLVEVEFPFGRGSTESSASAISHHVILKFEPTDGKSPNAPPVLTPSSRTLSTIDFASKEDQGTDKDLDIFSQVEFREVKQFPTRLRGDELSNNRDYLQIKRNESIQDVSHRNRSLSQIDCSGESRDESGSYGLTLEEENDGAESNTCILTYSIPGENLINIPIRNVQSEISLSSVKDDSELTMKTWESSSALESTSFRQLGDESLWNTKRVRCVQDGNLCFKTESSFPTVSEMKYDITPVLFRWCQITSNGDKWRLLLFHKNVCVEISRSHRSIPDDQENKISSIPTTSRKRRIHQRTCTNISEKGVYALDLDVGFEAMVEIAEIRNGLVLVVETKQMIPIFFKRCFQTAAADIGAQFAKGVVYHPCNVMSNNNASNDMFFADTEGESQGNIDQEIHWCHCPNELRYIFGFSKSFIDGRSFKLSRGESFMKLSFGNGKEVAIFYLNVIDGERDKYCQGSSFKITGTAEVYLGKELWWDADKAHDVVTKQSIPEPTEVSDVVVKSTSFRSLLRRHSFLTDDERNEYQQCLLNHNISTMTENNRKDRPRNIHHLENIMQYIRRSTYETIEIMGGYWKEKFREFPMRISMNNLVIDPPSINNTAPLNPFTSGQIQESVVVEIQVSRYIQDRLKALSDHTKSLFLQQFRMKGYYSDRLKHFEKLFVPITAVGADMFNVYFTMPYYELGSVWAFFQHHVGRSRQLARDVNSISNVDRSLGHIQPFKCTELQVKQMGVEIGVALALLHRLGIVHLDCSLENFVFQRLDPNSEISSPKELKSTEDIENFFSRISFTLLDFGQARWKSDLPSTEVDAVLNESQLIMIPMPSPPLRGIGKAYYFAPETVRSVCKTTSSHLDGRKVDVWQFGVCLLILLAGCENGPFDRMTNYQAWISCCESGLHTFMDINGTFLHDLVSPECFELLQMMLTVDPSKRCTMEDVLRHRWITSIFHNNKRLI